jgi:hypothetical protein
MKKRKDSKPSPRPASQQATIVEVSRSSPTVPTDSSASRPKTPNRKTSSKLREKIVFWFKTTLIVFVLVSPFVMYISLYRASLKQTQFTVDRRERVTKGSGDSEQSYFLVWSLEGEVYCVTDTYSFMKFDSADRYGKLREGSLVTAKIAGWRFPFWSWYRNVIEIEKVEPMRD